MISKPSGSNLKHLVTDRLSSEEKQKVDLAFAHAMNKKVLSFQAFDTPEFLQIEKELELPRELTNILNRSSYWDKLLKT